MHWSGGVRVKVTYLERAPQVKEIHFRKDSKVKKTMKFDQTFCGGTPIECVISRDVKLHESDARSNLR